MSRDSPIKLFGWTLPFPEIWITGMYVGVMVKSIFAKITDAKRFLCFLMIKNTPAERKSPWDSHKSFRSKICSGGGGDGGGGSDRRHGNCDTFAFVYDTAK